MMWYAMAKLGVYPAAKVVKVDDTAPGIGEGIAAGTWTVGITLTGNEVGLSAAALAALSEAGRAAHRARAGAVLKQAGAHLVIDSIADLPKAIDAIEAQLAAGETPRS
jgi:phosphonoacetaldehyde hydrolase